MTSILGYKTADLGQWAVLFALKNVYYKRDDHNYQNIECRREYMSIFLMFGYSNRAVSNLIETALPYASHWWIVNSFLA